MPAIEFFYSLVSAMNRIGLALCSTYVVATASCVSFAFAVDDAKGKFVLLQLPIALQAALLQGIGLGPLLESLPWAAAYLLLGLPTVALLYFVGALFSLRSANPSFQRTASGGH